MRGKIEEKFVADGLTIVGVDEVGRGCLAGPVVACCAALNYSVLFSLPEKDLNLIRDSKTLSVRQRQYILPIIREVAVEAYIGHASVEEIETHNILNATFLAMRRALSGLKHTYDLLLVDGKQEVAGYQGRQMAIIDGDAHAFAIAAASILAKEHRDDYMREQSIIYPQYGFERHVGYGTQVHLQSMKEHGVCPLHRKTFAPVAKLLAASLVMPAPKSDATPST